VVTTIAAFVAGYVGYELTDAVQKISEGNVAVAQRDAALANEGAAKANEAAARANERAAEANRKAEEERLARVKIEQRLADRSVSDAQVATIATKLHRYSRQPYRLTTYWDLKEPKAVSDRIHSALQLAGWELLPPPVGGSFLFGGMAGVQVWSHPAAPAQTRFAADALVAALNEQGLSAERRLMNAQEPVTNEIALNVGAKP
jgi:hypothetical protein